MANQKIQLCVLDLIHHIRVVRALYVERVGAAARLDAKRQALEGREVAHALVGLGAEGREAAAAARRGRRRSPPREDAG